MPAEPAEDATRGVFHGAAPPSRDELDDVLSRDAIAGALESSVEDDDVEMHVEVQAAAEPLHEGHGASVGLHHSFTAGAAAMVRERLLDEESIERGQYA